MKNNLFPFISIVIASFNRKDIIEESIKSTLNQQYKEDPFYYADDYSEWLKKSFYHYGTLKEGDPNTKQKFFD